MRGKSIVLILIALGCGLVASIGISQVLGRSGGPAATKMETEKVLVALTDIDIASPLTAENVKLEDWPKDRIPQGAIRDLEETTDLLPKSRMYAGEVILATKLSNSTDGNSNDIPAGYRVMAVKVDDQKSVAGLILPGDQVDVMVFMRQTNEVPITATQTVLRNVRVFAVDQKVDRDIDSNGKSISARTVSLIVKPEDGETLMLASNLGTLSLSLRRPNDETKDNSSGATVDKLLTGGASSPVQPTKQAQGFQPDQGESLQDWLDRVKDDQPDEEAAAVTSSASPWSMTMHTPDGVQMFQWTDSSMLPNVVALGASGAPALAPPIVSAPESSANVDSSGDAASGSVDDGEPQSIDADAGLDDATIDQDDDGTFGDD
jgi:pilus assembly protein CpaB